jgi:hypothetical protein
MDRGVFESVMNNLPLDEKQFKCRPTPAITCWPLNMMRWKKRGGTPQFSDGVFPNHSLGLEKLVFLHKTTTHLGQNFG